MGADLESGALRRRWGSARQLVAVGVVVCFLGLLAYGVISKAPNTAIDNSLAQAHPVPAPDLTLPVLEPGELGSRLGPRLAPALADGQVSLTELRGTSVVLNFWASWCVPCRKEAPILERAWLDERRAGVLFLGLNMQDLTGDARAFVDEFHNTYLNIRDQGSDTAHRWGVTGVPETFFITPAGKIVAHVIGVVSGPQLRQGIEATRTGQALGAQAGGESRPTR